MGVIPDKDEARGSDQDDILDKSQLGESAEEDQDEIAEDKDEEQDIKDIKFSDLNQIDRKPIQVKWFQGSNEDGQDEQHSNVFAILYNRLIEVYDLEGSGSGDKPCSRTIFDNQVNSFDFVSSSCIVIADSRNHLIILKNFISK